MKWIIENLTKEQGHLELSDAVKRAGIECLDLRGDFRITDIEHLKTGIHPIVFCGSIEMNKLISTHLKETCFPLSYSTFQNYLCSKYYPIYGKLLFNDKYFLIPFNDIKRQKWLIYNTFGKEAMVFIRPDSGDKTFKAGLVDLQDFDQFCDDLEYLGNELVLVSTPKNILGEWRFIVDRTKRIIAVSSYRYQGLLTRVPSAPRQATEFCQEILNVGYFPDSVFAIDVVQTHDQNCYLMELTSFSSAGLYNCNKDAIVKAVTEIATDDFKILKKSTDAPKT